MPTVRSTGFPVERRCAGSTTTMTATWKDLGLVNRDAYTERFLPTIAI
jgi:hypothetical protein